MSLRIEDDQLIFDCCYMTKKQFYTVYNSWFDWTESKCNEIYQNVRELVVDKELIVKSSLKKSKKCNVRQGVKGVPNYKLIEV